jgi:hypothetical protein
LLVLVKAVEAVVDRYQKEDEGGQACEGRGEFIPAETRKSSANDRLDQPRQ